MRLLMVGGFTYRGPGPIPPPEESTEQEQERELQSIGRCKRCGKETELLDGLCTECRWEIEAGLQRPLQQERKHHFWSHDKTESQEIAEHPENDSGTSPDE